MPSFPPNSAILSTQPRHSLYPTPPFPLPNRTNPSTDPHQPIYRSPPFHLPIPTITSTEPHQLFYGTMLSPPNFCPIPAKRYHRLCAPSPQFQRTCPLTPLHQCTHRSVPAHPILSRKWSGCTMGTERCSHTIKSLLPYCPSGCMEVSGKSL